MGPFLKQWSNIKQFYAINDTQPDNETRAALQDMIDAIENGTLAINRRY